VQVSRIPRLIQWRDAFASARAAATIWEFDAFASELMSPVFALAAGGCSEVAVIGQGTWYIENNQGGAAAAIVALRRGLDLGMTYIDTAEMFGIRGYSGGGSIRGLAIRGARNALADRLKILLDMNLSPSWIASLESGGHSAVHWSSIGSPSARDTEIMAWARENSHIVLTNDLDYGALLFATAAASPSVIQIRARISDRRVLNMLQTYQDLLTDPFCSFSKVVILECVVFIRDNLFESGNFSGCGVADDETNERTTGACGVHHSSNGRRPSYIICRL
jgi:predicted nuclease of predicted toxin-antitoxin system